MNVFEQGALEGFEEFTQYTSQVMLETMGPTAYKNETFSEEYDWNEAIESAVGGFMGGGTMSLSRDMLNKSGIMHRAANFRNKMHPGKNNIIVKKDPEDGI